MKKIIGLTVAILALTLALVGCDANTNSNSRTLRHDRNIATQQLGAFQRNQPVPIFTYSQLRQNLIEIETAQSQTTQTTSFFFNQGVQDPVASCPSIGFPIPATYQLDSPQARESNHEAVLPQIEANGVYTADTTGTYVICVNAQGQAYANYWEGFVNTVTGPAKWNTQSHGVELVGPPSFQFSTSKENKK